MTFHMQMKLGFSLLLLCKSVKGRGTSEGSRSGLHEPSEASAERVAQSDSLDWKEDHELL